MKRCKFCGRQGSRMVETRSPFFGNPDGWKCAHPVACTRRQEQLGQWHGKRVFYRQDADGTRWTIRRAREGVSGGPVYTLTCEYRQHRASTSHFTVDAAKAHVDDLIASWTARTLRDYTEARR